VTTKVALLTFAAKWGQFIEQAGQYKSIA